MTGIKELFKKIETRIEELENTDFTFILGTMISCAQLGRLNNVKEKSYIIEDYFRKSPEVYGFIKDYSPMRTLTFLERIIKRK